MYGYLPLNELSFDAQRQNLGIPFIKNIKIWQKQFVDGCNQGQEYFGLHFSVIPKTYPATHRRINGILR